MPPFREPQNRAVSGGPEKPEGLHSEAGVSLTSEERIYTTAEKQGGVISAIYL